MNIFDNLIIRRKKKLPNHIYLMKNKQGYIKIGISSNPYYREKTLQSQEPNLVLIYSKKISTAPQIEKILHEVYDRWRLRGEWFKLNKKQVETCIRYLESIECTQD